MTSHAEIVPDIRPWPDSVQAKGDYYLCPDGQRRVRVTKVVKHINDGGENLYNWYEANGKEAALETVRRHFEWCKGMTGDSFVERIRPEIKATKASLVKLEKAGDIGSQIHEMIRWRMRQELTGDAGVQPALSDPATVGYMAFDDFWKASGLKPVLAEQWAWDDSDNSAGQWDLIAEGPDGYELLDWKSSNYITVQHHVQVAKYKQIIELWRPNMQIVRTRIVRIPKSLDKIQIEERELGDCYNFATEKMFRPNLETLWLSALAQYRIFKEI